MFTTRRLAIWFKAKRNVFSNIRIIIDNEIAFVYAQLGKDREKNWARISLKDKKTLNELNPFEYE